MLASLFLFVFLLTFPSLDYIDGNRKNAKDVREKGLIDEIDGKDKQINPGREGGHVLLTDKIKGKNNEGKSREALRWRRRQEESSSNVFLFLFFFFLNK